jgi:riboflavin synthase
MFTGLIQQIGALHEVRTTTTGKTFRIESSFETLVLGESIAVDGTCLTVTTKDGGHFTADASSETLAKTTLNHLQVGARVHLERALRAGDALGGHIVTGHVDGMGSIAKREPSGDAVCVTFAVPEPLRGFMAPKGSITVNGVSLTINGAASDTFDVMLVPYTRSHTHFDGLALGAPVNLEVDVIAKYVARLLGRPGVDGVSTSPGVTLDQLARGGYLYTGKSS